MGNLKFDNTYARLPEHWFQRVAPTPLKASHLISFNAPLAVEMGLDPCEWTPDQIARTFGGQQLPEGADPLAMKYTGHQFGTYNPDLGDGRGVLLGEHLAPDGRRWDLHLKGAGKTAFSRFADGKAVLRSSIREYLVSEAMYGLGIPTTRALCLLGSEEVTLRNGMEYCAQVLRVTPCHVRFGHFEYFYYSGQHADLKALADYVIERYYPDLQTKENAYLAMYQEVVKRSAKLVALWQSYGFVHGVLNTDNMSIIGESFDYGPFTFMDRYETDHTANKNDERGRYAFKNQPSIMQWNLAALAQALLPLIEREDLEAVLDSFGEQYYQFYYARMRARLGLQTEQPNDLLLIDEFLQRLERGRGDLNRFLYWLTDYTGGETLDESAGNDSGISDWLKRFMERRASEAVSDPMCSVKSRAVNPLYILRNYMAEDAIRDAQEGDYRLVNQLLAMLRNPHEVYPALAEYAGTPPEWAASICLTCSS